MDDLSSPELLISTFPRWRMAARTLKTSDWKSSFSPKQTQRGRVNIMQHWCVIINLTVSEVCFTQEWKGLPSLLHAFPVIYTFNYDIATHACVEELICTHSRKKKQLKITYTDIRYNSEILSQTFTNLLSFSALNCGRSAQAHSW